MSASLPEYWSYLKRSHEVLGTSADPRRYLAKRKVEDPQVESHLLGYTADHSHLSDVHEEVAEWARRLPKNALLFPLYTPHLGHTGVIFRTIAEKKYGHIPFLGYEKFPRFFCTKADLEAAFFAKSVYTTEGPFDKMALSLAFSNVVSTITSDCSQDQLAYLLGMVEVLVCAYDMDKAGEEGWKKMSIPASKVGEAYRLKLPYNDLSKTLEEMGKGRFIDLVKTLGETLTLIIET